MQWALRCVRPTPRDCIRYYVVGRWELPTDSAGPTSIYRVFRYLEYISESPGHYPGGLDCAAVSCVVSVFMKLRL